MLSVGGRLVVDNEIDTEQRARRTWFVTLHDLNISEDTDADAKLKSSKSVSLVTH